MSLYNAKHTPEGILMTKFTDDLDVEETAGKPASYIVSTDTCDCPAGHRDTCRHRDMLPLFIHRISTPWFFDYDNNRWYYYNAQAGQLQTKEPKPSWRRI